MFGVDDEKWKKLNGFNTATEIYQQPKLWLEVLKIVEDNKDDINKFLEARLKKDKVRVIFAGAGTSAYVGEIATQQLNMGGEYIYEAIATTDIVANPEIYFKKDIPTILVSFARSGNSPESVATYNLANEMIDEVSHIFITCNVEGKLAEISQGKENVLLLLMPEESNDKGFAMTSSFSCMTLTALLIFDMGNFENNKKQILEMATIGKDILKGDQEEIKGLIDPKYNRIVYLGSSTFRGLTKESGLKLLELTRGQIISHSETTLGFRHGPKSITNDNTLIFIYISEDPYTRKYDIDMLKEIYNDEGGHRVIAISNKYYEEVEENSNKYFYLNKDGNNIDNTGFMSLLYALYAQLVALFYSINVNVEPDDPNPSGIVNRVVKGVTIYKKN
ncbi:SIS domain-containing protein [Clostridium sp. Cult3]|uniref:SIS domain-containing protein n=1 Tax=Clostridium sp. Cult3 TaxID=2079004 RepID=UPI001F0162E9|nr:SIS domain-containing protein [Clostridium sp. Cult3]MCF6461379.1 hypothetical protein [Clostridium sp. Cult3]